MKTQIYEDRCSLISWTVYLMQCVLNPFFLVFKVCLYLLRLFNIEVRAAVSRGLVIVLV